MRPVRMPERVARIRRHLCDNCPAPCAPFVSGENPHLDPARACPLQRWGPYDLNDLSVPGESSVATPLPPPRPVSPAHWGPPLWAELHRTARAGGLSALFLADFNRRIPSFGCPCGSHWKTLLAALPPPFDADPETQFAWTVAAHNHVREAQGKPPVTLDEARALYPAHA